MAVRLQQLTITLTGAAQQLTTDDIRLREVTFQPLGTTANPIFIGAQSTMTSTAYGVRLPASAAGVPPAPFLMGEFEDGSVQLSDFWVLGTAAEVLQVFYVRYI